MHYLTLTCDGLHLLYYNDSDKETRKLFSTTIAIIHVHICKTMHKSLTSAIMSFVDGDTFYLK